MRIVGAEADGPAGDGRGSAPPRNQLVGGVEPTVIPGQRESRAVGPDCQRRVELGRGGRVGVDLHRRAPGTPAVRRLAKKDVAPVRAGDVVVVGDVDLARVAGIGRHSREGVGTKGKTQATVDPGPHQGCHREWRRERRPAIRRLLHLDPPRIEAGVVPGHVERVIRGDGDVGAVRCSTGAERAWRTPGHPTVGRARFVDALRHREAGVRQIDAAGANPGRAVDRDPRSVDTGAETGWRPESRAPVGGAEYLNAAVETQRAEIDVVVRAVTRKHREPSIAVRAGRKLAEIGPSRTHVGRPGNAIELIATRVHEGPRVLEDRKEGRARTQDESRVALGILGRGVVRRVVDQSYWAARRR